MMILTPGLNAVNSTHLADVRAMPGFRRIVPTVYTGEMKSSPEKRGSTNAAAVMPKHLTKFLKRASHPKNSLCEAMFLQWLSSLGVLSCKVRELQCCKAFEALGAISLNTPL
eukprot:1016268-Amphidinium_carterae.1